MEHLLAQADALIRAGHHQEAITLLDSCAAPSSGKLKALYLKGVALFYSGQIDAGIDTMEELSRRSGDNARIHRTLAGMLLREHRWERATRAFRRVYELRPHHFSAMREMVTTLASWCQESDGRAAPPAPPPQPIFADDRLLSVIICSIDRGKEERVVAMYQRLLAGLRTEFICIRDARSLSEGYNRGIDESSGAILLFSHDDVDVLSPNFAEYLLLHLARFDLVGVAGTSRLVDGSWVSSGWPWTHGMVVQPLPQHACYALNLYNTRPGFTPGIQAMDGLFLAVNRRVVEQIRFDAERFDGFHHYDLDFTFSAWRAGFSLAVCNDFLFLHESSGVYDDRWLLYRDRFHAKHQKYFIALPEQKNGLIAIRFKRIEQVQAFWKRLAVFG
ncbi:MAG: glycosyltransferase [Magnetococcus sp. YQC-3]